MESKIDMGMGYLDRRKQQRRHEFHDIEKWSKLASLTSNPFLDAEAATSEIRKKNMTNFLSSLMKELESTDWMYGTR